MFALDSASAPENMSLTPYTAFGKRDKMLIVIISDTPLPIPRSVICSPNHISNIVPVVKTIVVWMRYHQIQLSGYKINRLIGTL